MTPNLKCHTHIHTHTRRSVTESNWRPACPLNTDASVFHNCVTSLMTYSAFFITLREHGDSAGSCFPDHPPKVSHCARQRSLGGDELIRTQVALKAEKQTKAFICDTIRKQEGMEKYVEQRSQTLSHSCKTPFRTFNDANGSFPPS